MKGQNLMGLAEYAKGEKIVLLDPRGDITKEVRPLVDRTPDLNDKLVYLADMGKPDGEIVLQTAAELLKERFPRVKTAYIAKKKPYLFAEPEFSPGLYGQKEGKADAAIVAIGD